MHPVSNYLPEEPISERRGDEASPCPNCIRVVPACLNALDQLAVVSALPKITRRRRTTSECPLMASTEASHPMEVFMGDQNTRQP